MSSLSTPYKRNLLGFDISFLIILALLIFFLHSQIAFFDWGEVTTPSWLVTKGYLPYKDFFDHHAPGLYYLTAAFMKIFGNSLEVIKYETILVIITSIILLYFF